MSYYQGDVVKLTHLSGSKWELVSVYYLDTNSDENILTNFMHKGDTRVVIIPAGLVKNFDPASTKYVVSGFDHVSCTEYWEATQ
jgi:hypothetical protein